MVSVKVYLAARYQEHPAIAEFARFLGEAGIQVTARWFDGSHEIRPGRDADEQLREFAQMDLDDIDRADALVLWNPPAHHGTGSGGRHVEVGYAIGKAKPVFIVGEVENVFHRLPGVAVVKDWTALRSALAAGWSS